jgi:hypothetical protein
VNPVNQFFEGDTFESRNAQERILTLAPVTPTCSRLYRGFAIRKPWLVQSPCVLRPVADCKSAIRQVSNLRYASAVSECAQRSGRESGITAATKMKV